MELLFASDLHYGATRRGDENVRALAERACAEGADVLVLAGDLANSREVLEACLALFDRFEGHKLAVPGNHDVWTVDNPELGSWARHDSVLPELYRRRGFHPLHLTPFRVGSLALVGSMGWYDGTFIDPIGVEPEHYRRKVYPGTPRVSWADARYARFGASDVELTDRLLQRLEAQLAQVADAADVVAVVHHLVSRRLLFHPRCLIPRHWRFANAFLGSARFGQLLTAHPKVRQVFCGHVHHAHTIVERGVRMTTVGADHAAKQLVRAGRTGLLSRQWFGEPFDVRSVRPRPTRRSRSG